MLKGRILTMLAATAFAAAVAVTAPAAAQSPPSGPAATTTAKKLTPQQQKMKDCGAKWQDHKKTTGEKGRDAYRKFLSTCLKK